LDEKTKKGGSQKADILAIYSTTSFGDARAVRDGDSRSHWRLRRACCSIGSGDAPGLVNALAAVVVWLMWQVLGFSLLWYLKLPKCDRFLANLPAVRREAVSRSRRRPVFELHRRSLLRRTAPGLGFWLGLRFQQPPAIRDATSAFCSSDLHCACFGPRRRWRNEGQASQTRRMTNEACAIRVSKGVQEAGS